MKIQSVAVLGAGAVGSYVIWGLSHKKDIRLGVIAEGERADRLKKDGCGVLVTTHVMSEAEMTDSVALLMDGRIIANDAPAALKQSYGVGSIEEVFLKAERVVNAHA